MSQGEFLNVNNKSFRNLWKALNKFWTNWTEATPSSVQRAPWCWGEWRFPSLLRWMGMAAYVYEYISKFIWKCTRVSQLVLLKQKRILKSVTMLLPMCWWFCKTMACIGCCFHATLMFEKCGMSKRYCFLQGDFRYILHETIEDSNQRTNTTTCDMQNLFNACHIIEIDHYCFWTFKGPAKTGNTYKYSTYTLYVCIELCNMQAIASHTVSIYINIYK